MNKMTKLRFSSFLTVAVSLWIALVLNSQARSSLVNAAQDQVKTLNLHNWQSLLIGDHASGKTKLGFVMPKSVSIETSRAMAMIACDLGTNINSQNIELVDSPEQALSSIIIGTPQENSQIAKFSLQLPLSADKSTFLDTAGKEISTDSGIIELVYSPDYPKKVTLLITGASPAAVLKAAVALTNQNANPVVCGSYAIVSQPMVATPGEKLFTNRSHYMPSKKLISLTDLGYSTQSTQGVDSKTITVEFNTAPGIAFLGPAPRLDIFYGYSAQLNPERSSLEVRLNDVPIGSFPLADTDGDIRTNIDCTLPAKLIGPRNKLDFVFYLVPLNTDKSSSLSDAHIWGTLYEDTSVEIDREYLAKLPDLSLLKYAGFPLLEDRSLKDLAIVLPSKTPAQALSGLTKFAFLLGQWGAQPAAQINVYYDDNLPDDVRTSHHLVLFSPEKNSNAIQVKLLPYLRADQIAKPKILQSDRRKSNEMDTDALGIVQEILSPWAANKVILVVSAFNPQLFQYALAGILNSDVRCRLTGSLCSISPELIMQGITFGAQRTISIILPWRYAALILSSHVWIAPLLTILSIIVATFYLKAFLDRKRANPR